MLVEPGACSAAWLHLAAQCAETLGARAYVLGTGEDRRSAEAQGLHVERSCAPLMGSALLSWRTLLRTFGGGVGPRTIVAWSARGAAIGAAIARRTIAVAPCAPATPELHELLARGARARTAVDVLPYCAAAAENWPKSHGWRVHAPIAAVPTVAAVGDRADIRRRWDVAENEFALALIGDPPRIADVQRAVDVVGRATLALGIIPRCRFVLVVHPHAAHARAAFRWASTTPTLVRVAFDSVIGRAWEVAPALDAAICADVVPPTRIARSSRVLVAAALTSGGADHDSTRGAIDALILARAGVPVLATVQSAAAAFLVSVPELTFCERRPSVGAHALLSVLLKRSTGQDALRASVAALPGPAALSERIALLLSAQRAAA